MVRTVDFQSINRSSILLRDAMKIETNKEYLCEWPNKDTRKVMVTSLKDDSAFILWNERHSPIKGQGCVVGLDDTVPITWLRDI